MIQIYKIRIKAEVSEIGCHPQVQPLPTENWDHWGKTSVSCLPLEGIIPFRPQFPRLGLEEAARCTDLMSTVVSSGKMLMISENLYKVFSTYLADAHQCFMEPVETPNGKIPYLFLYMNFPRDEEIFDWPKCIFFDANDPEKKMFSVPNAKAYYAARNGKVIRHERLVLRAGQPVYDLFRCRYFGSGKLFYVTSRMRTAIESAGITGIRFEQFDVLEIGDL